MTLSQLTKEVNSLKRKYASQLAVVRLRRLAQEFCDQWEAARDDGKPPMSIVESGQWFIRVGFRPRSFNGLFDCIRRCNENKEAPLPIDIVKAFLPRAGYRNIIRSVFKNVFTLGDQTPRRVPLRGALNPANITPAFPIMEPLWAGLPCPVAQGPSAARPGGNPATDLNDKNRSQGHHAGIHVIPYPRRRWSLQGRPLRHSRESGNPGMCRAHGGPPPGPGMTGPPVPNDAPMC